MEQNPRAAADRDQAGSGLRDRLVAMLGRRRPEEPVLTVEAAPPVQTMVDFEAFTEDLRLWTRVRLDHDRLTDMLNAHEEFPMVDVIVAGLDSGIGTTVRELLVSRRDLLAVRTGGVRGRPERRSRTRAHPVSMKIGPYTIHGYLHAKPGADPLASMARRRPMVPLTDARIEWDGVEGPEAERVGALIVNQHAITWIAPAIDEVVRLPYLAFGPESGLPVKDFTGSVVA